MENKLSAHEKAMLTVKALEQRRIARELKKENEVMGYEKQNYDRYYRRERRNKGSNAKYKMCR